MYYTHITHLTFIRALRQARASSVQVQAATTPETHLDLQEGDRAYLSHSDALSGFVVRKGGELCAVFSLVGGRGDDLLESATRLGAAHLDCFDGYLPTLYARHGFVETHRGVNWNPGAPDVVFMKRGAL